MLNLRVPLLLFMLFSTSEIFSQFNNFQKYPHTKEFYDYQQNCLLELENGELALIYDENDTLKISRTLNNWTEWGTPDTVKDPYLGIINYVFNLNAIVTNSGRIIIGYISGGEIGSVRFVYSDDNGNSWMQSQIQTPPTPRGNSASLSLMGESEVWCTFKNIQNNIVTIKSNDNGSSWSTQEFISLLSSEDNAPHPIIEILNNGSLLLAYLDSDNGRNFLYGKTSNDSGHTWSSRFLISDYGEDFIRLKSVKESSGNILLSLQTEFFLPDSIQKQNDIIFLESVDGLNWTTPQKFTNYLNEDSYQYTSNLSDKTLVSFISDRENEQNQIWYGLANQPSDTNVPPFIKSRDHNYLNDQTILFRSNVFDDQSISSVNLIYTLNDGNTYTFQMFDNGIGPDSTANDHVYSYSINSFSASDKISFKIKAEDNDANVVESLPEVFYMNLNVSSNNTLIEVNNIKMPIDSKGSFAYVRLGSLSGFPTSLHGEYDDVVFLFNGGFFLSGLVEGVNWANGTSSTNLVEDYYPGIVGSSPDSPLNLIYKISSGDPAFGTSWQLWKHAVEQGARFYDGDNNGKYTPVDLNANGTWDTFEDRPDLIGDAAYYCVYNDAVPSKFRRFNEVEPLGIEIRQTVFVSSGTINNFLKDIIFVRYEIENTGTVSDRLDSVLFSNITDPDIGDISDDLIGSDIKLQSGYCYNEDDDSKYGQNPPAAFFTLIQGPPYFKAGKTFTDNNSDGIYSPEIDTPIDTAISKLGPYIDNKLIEGAANAGLNSVSTFDISPDDLIYKSQLRNYMKGGHKGNGDSIYVSDDYFGNGSTLGTDTSNIESRFIYSGDPVAQTGWLNIRSNDQRLFTTTGPFELVAGKPVEIIYAYIVGRGSDALNSITVAREITEYAHNLYKNNFDDMFTESVSNNNLIVNDYILHENFPNPFNPSTTIRFQIPAHSQNIIQANTLSVKLIVYDILGRKVKTLVNDQKSPGKYEVVFDGSKLASGVYFYQLTAGSFVQTKKLMLLK